MLLHYTGATKGKAISATGLWVVNCVLVIWTKTYSRRAPLFGAKYSGRLRLRKSIQKHEARCRESMSVFGFPCDKIGEDVRDMTPCTGSTDASPIACHRSCKAFQRTILESRYLIDMQPANLPGFAQPLESVTIPPTLMSNSRFH